MMTTSIGFYQPYFTIQLISAENFRYDRNEGTKPIPMHVKIENT